MAVTKPVILEGRYSVIAKKLWKDGREIKNFQTVNYFERLLDVWLIAGIVGVLVKEKGLAYNSEEYFNVAAQRSTIYLETLNNNWHEINLYLQLVAFDQNKSTHDESGLRLSFQNQVDGHHYDQQRVDSYHQFVQVGLDYIDSEWLQSDNTESVLIRIQQFVETFNPQQNTSVSEYDVSEGIFNTIWNQ